MRRGRQLWVILDRLTQSHQPAHVRIALKATKVLNGGETTICAKSNRTHSKHNRGAAVPHVKNLATPNR
jgi:hypothetical protein